MNNDRRVAMWPRWMRNRRDLPDEESDYHGLIVLRWPASSHRREDNPDGPVRPDQRRFEGFAQLMINRLMVGWVNGYGLNRRYRYLTRLMKEVLAYFRTGNKEHLINVANYAYLEFQQPEHPEAHWDPEVGTVTGGQGLGDNR